MFVIIETRAQEVRALLSLGRSLGTMGNWIMALGLVRAHNVPSIAIVIFVMLSGLILVMII